MNDKDLPAFDNSDEDDTSTIRFGQLATEITEALSADGPPSQDVTLSGSFDFRRIRRTAFGKLLSGLPIPALLIDRYCSIVFCNAACHKSVRDRDEFLGSSFLSLFPDADQSWNAQACLEGVFQQRKPITLEALVQLGENQMWGRLYFRSIRLGEDRLVMVLIEDLTIEKEQIILNERYRKLVSIVPVGIAEFAFSGPISPSTTAQELLTGIMEATLVDGNAEFARLHGLDTVRDLRESPLGTLLGSEPGYGPLFRMWIEDNCGIYTAESGELRPDGTTRYAENTLIGNIDNDLLTGFWILSRDITGRRLQEEALRESEKRFREIYENSPIMKHSIDEQGIIRNVNRQWLEELGYTRKEVLGTKIDLFMTPESAQRAFSTVLPKFWSDGRVSNVPYQYVKKDGAVIDVILDSVAITDPKWGRISLSTVRNITDHKRAEEEAVRTKALLTTIVQNLPTAVYLKDAAKLRYFLWNKASEQLFGYFSEEVLGKTVYDLFPGPQADSFTEQDQQALRDGTLLDIIEEPVDTQHMGQRTVHSKKLPIFDMNGRPRFLLGISEDITERKRTEQEIIEARVAAEEANQAKSDFLASMSHEIRTPMHGIMGMTELALQTQLTEEQRDYLETIKISADALLALINDILDFSKIEAGKFDLEAIEFNLRDTIFPTVESMRVHAQNKKLDLTCQVQPDLPNVLIGDPLRVRQILINLLGNAIKFTESGQVSVHVSTESLVGEDLVLHFAVSDTGIGMPDSKLGEIFSPFTQLSKGMSRKYGGTGLGLAISKELIGMMNGRIWVESRVGSGSTFHFTAKFGVREKASEAICFPTCNLDLQGLSVLVVDSNATNRRILEDMLRHLDMRPTTCESAAAGLTALYQIRESGLCFPVIIVDAQMPEMDGFDFVDQVNKVPGLSKPTIIMLTSSGRREDAQRCKELGISAYLWKPVGQTDLFRAIQTTLGMAQADTSETSLVTKTTLTAVKRRLSILLAEDNLVNQRLATRLLEQKGHSVVVASNGKEALEAMENQQFDLVLMDVEMPDMSGFEVTAAIREQEGVTGKHTPIIAVTAHAMKGDMDRCLAAGMDGYLAKPVKSAELFEAIEKFAKNTQDGYRFMPRQALSEPALDTSALMNQVGGDVGFLRKLAGLFLAESQDRLSDLEVFVKDRYADGIARSAHSLKGSLGSLHAARASKAALNLEQIAKGGNVELAPEAFETLKKEIGEVRTALEKLGATDPG